MSGLKAKLVNLNDKEKEAVSHLLIKIALADGKIDPMEIKQLEKLYITLGLEKSLVTKDILRLSTSIETKLQSSNYVKQPIKSNSDIDASGFKLDKSILAIHESETKDVQNMLEKIFTEEEKLKDEVVSFESQSSENNLILDDKHNKLYQILITKEKWARKEVEEICHEIDLLVDGAIETINDWSFEKVDSPVLDDDDDIFVDKEIVEEIAG